MAERPTLFVCHGDDGGPRFHPCRRVQEALRAANIDYDKVIAGHGSLWPFLRKGSRDETVRGDRSEKAAGAQASRRDRHHPLARHPGLDPPAELIPRASPAADPVGRFDQRRLGNLSLRTLRAIYPAVVAAREYLRDRSANRSAKPS
jgi:hypothetical protein